MFERELDRCFALDRILVFCVPSNSFNNNKK
jgi:hypothetical protein